jgi:hypothetical protein
MDFTDTPRRTSLVSRMSTTDFSLYSSSEVRTSSSSFSFSSIFEALPRKSKRVAISYDACCTAFETSWRSTLLTTSNEKSWGTGGFYFLAVVLPFPVIPSPSPRTVILSEAKDPLRFGGVLVATLLGMTVGGTTRPAVSSPRSAFPAVP